MAHEEQYPEDEPIRFTDNRKIDPETGQPREQGETGHGEATPDPLSQAEQIPDEAGVAADAAAQAGHEAGAAEAELKNDLLRLQAEFTNYRRRVERDKQVAKDNGINQSLGSLIPVLDDVDAARAAGDLVDGPFAAIATKLDAALAGLGLERIDAVGVEFDPNIHEAVMRQPVPGVAAEHVGQVFRIGFRRGDRTLRAAQVMVSTGE